MFRYLYIVKVGNQHGNIMIFTSYQTAFDWCKEHTAWDNIKIINTITKVVKDDDRNYFVMPF